MNSRRFSTQFVCVAFAALCVFTASSESGYAQFAPRNAVEVFGDSPVDSIAAKIKADVSRTKAEAKTPSEGTKPPTPSGAESVSRETKFKPPTAARVKAVEANAQKCQTADEAIILFKIFLTTAGLTEEEKEQGQSRLEYWEQASTDQLVRVGTKWMPKSEADGLKKEADNLVAEALEMLNVDNFIGANAKLERAGKVYPEHLDSIFLLAVGAFLSRDFKSAEARFKECLQRAPENVSLLNNVAVCEIQTKRYAPAVKHWEKAGGIDLENRIVAQNLGQFISDANLKKLGVVDKKTIADASDLYQKMVSKDPGNRSNTAKGYVLSRLLRPKGTESPVEESRVVGNGTGFVVSPGYILTNRHVVEDADSLVIQDPVKPERMLAAKVLAVSKDLDIALVECRDLKAAPLSLNANSVGRGTEVMALGFPIATVVGKGLKATRGIVTGLPSEETDRMMVLDVQVNPGNSGGPLCDRTGSVVGVISAKTITTGFVQSYGLAIPLKDVMPFLNQNLRGFTPVESKSKTVEWTDVDAMASPSTVMIIIQKKR
ncbi:MAG: trypsin-like peptidase domain-containing protein [Planctomycetaceae bacterium]